MLTAATYMYSLYNTTKGTYLEVANDISTRSWEFNIHPFSLFETLEEVEALKQREQKRSPNDSFEIIEHALVFVRHVPS